MAASLVIKLFYWFPVQNFALKIALKSETRKRINYMLNFRATFNLEVLKTGSDGHLLILIICGSSKQSPVAL